MDTDVLVAAFRSDTGASRKILELVFAGDLELLVSVPLMFEYEAVLSRPEHLAASGASTEDVQDVLDGLAAVGRHVKFAFRWRPALRNSDDDMVLETAINGGAHAIVTFNERDFNPMAAEFGCKVLRPGQFLQTLAGETKSETEE